MISKGDRTMTNHTSKKADHNKLVVRVICIALAVAMIATMIAAFALR